MPGAHDPGNSDSSQTDAPCDRRHRRPGPWARPRPRHLPPGAARHARGAHRGGGRRQRRPGSFGERMVAEVSRSPAAPRIHLVNPRYAARSAGPAIRPSPTCRSRSTWCCSASPTRRSRSSSAWPPRRGDRSAVIFGGAYEVTAGAGRGLRGSGSPRTAHARPGWRCAAPAAWGSSTSPTGCGRSATSSRTRCPPGRSRWSPTPGRCSRRCCAATGRSASPWPSRPARSWSPPAADYLDYALSLPQTRVRRAAPGDHARPRAAAQVLAGGGRARTSRSCCSRSGASAAGAGHGGRALRRAGRRGRGLGGAVRRATASTGSSDLDELADTLELFARAPGGRGSRGRQAAGRPPGIATVHDSGLERALVADLADELGVPFAAIAPPPPSGSRAARPGPGARQPARRVGQAAATPSGSCPSRWRRSPTTRRSPPWRWPSTWSTSSTATSYPLAAERRRAAHRQAGRGADQHRRRGRPGGGGAAARGGDPGARGHPQRAARAASPARPRGPPGARRIPPLTIDAARRDYWVAGCWRGRSRTGPSLLDLLRDYGIAGGPGLPRPATGRRRGGGGAPRSATRWCSRPTSRRRAQVGRGRRRARPRDDPADLAAAYADLAARLGPRVLVCETAAPGTELALGIARDPMLGPLVVVGAGGVLVEVLRDRAVALPPVDPARARGSLDRLAGRPLLDGRPRRAARRPAGAVAGRSCAVSASSPSSSATGWRRSTSTR